MFYCYCEELYARVVPVGIWCRS